MADQSNPADVAQLLMVWSTGNSELLDGLMPRVYDELRRLTSRHLQRDWRPAKAWLYRALGTNH